MIPAARRLTDIWRATGADLPGGDPRASHGAEMEGYFWRITHPDDGRVVVALCGVNQAPGGPWATVALAVHPGGVVRSAAVDGAADDRHRLAVTAGSAFAADEGSLRVDLDDVHLDVALGASRGGTGLLPGGGLVGVLPGLGQYWHPHLVHAPVTGTVRVGDDTWRLDGAHAYAEKNWGRGFPERWWWGQADVFDRPDLAVAFGGGRLTAGPVGVDVTGLVCFVDGRAIRLAPPLARVETEVGDDRWHVRARGARHEVVVEGDGAGSTPAVLPVPLPAERRNVDTDLEHLAATMHLTIRDRRGPTIEATSHLAALEGGSRP